jgi:hypothetical protein
VPRMHTPLCTRRVLVMEWVDGERLRTAYSAAREVGVGAAAPQVGPPAVQTTSTVPALKDPSRQRWAAARSELAAELAVRSFLLVCRPPAGPATICGWWRWGCAALWSRSWRSVSSDSTPTALCGSQSARQRAWYQSLDDKHNSRALFAPLCRLLSRGCVGWLLLCGGGTLAAAASAACRLSCRPPARAFAAPLTVMLLTRPRAACPPTDPHPGNLLRTRDGKLAYLDFGMMGSVDATIRRYGRLELCFLACWPFAGQQGGHFPGSWLPCPPAPPPPLPTNALRVLGTQGPHARHAAPGQPRV